MVQSALIVPAAGSGERLGAGVPKALYAVGDEPMLVHAIRAGVDSDVVSYIVVAAPAGSTHDVAGILRAHIPESVGTDVVDGGRTRQESVAAAMAVLPAGIDVVLVHDAARCLAPASLFRNVVQAVESGHDAVVPGLPVVDTLKKVDQENMVVATAPRESLRAVQTPQGFRRHVLEQAHRTAQNTEAATDDAGLVERLGRPVHVVPGDPEAFKVTHPLDLLLAEAVLARRSAS